MKKNDKSVFLLNIRKALPSLHPTERRLAEFLLNFPGEIASYSASELAKLANVSNATVSRFIKKLGYDNYDAARRIVRAEQKSGAAIFKVAYKGASIDQVLTEHLEQNKSGIESTFALLNLVEIDELASAILKSKRVYLIGFRTSHAFAVYLQSQILQVVEDVVTLPAAGQTLAESVVAISPDDCVIFFSFPRRIRFSSELLAQITRSGANVAYISDEMAERDNKVAWHFQCNTTATGPLFNHVSVMSLVHLIATRVIELAGPAARKRLSAIEVLHDTFGEI